MAFIDSSIPSGSYAVLERIQTEEGQDDFDRGAINILFHGTEAQLRAAFPKGASGNFPRNGTSPAPGIMICAGVRVSRNRFGFLWARVEWIGLLVLPTSVELSFANGSTAAIRSITKTITTRELNFPVEGESGPINALAPLNGAGGKARARTTAITEEHGREYQLLLIAPRYAPLGTPRITSGITRPAGLTTVFNTATTGIYFDASRANWFDGISETGGWCCRDLQAGSSYLLGDWLLCRASAKFTWVDRYAPQ